MSNVIEIEITNVQCKVITKLDPYVASVLHEKCSFRPEGSEYAANYYARKKGIKWDGLRKLFNAQTHRFPVGLLSMVTKSLNEMGYDVTYINDRIAAQQTIGQHPFYIANYEEREYQTRAVNASVANGNGIIKAATGSGKTTIAARTIFALQSRTIFIVHTRDLLYQTIEAFQRMFPAETIGQIGDGVFNWSNVTVATMQSLAIIGDVKYESSKYDEDGIAVKEDKKFWKREDIKKEFADYVKTVAVVMFDEVQLISSQTAFSVRFLFDRANFAFGYSASPWRDDGSDLMIEAAFGPRIVDITASELIDLGYLVQPIIEIKKVRNNTYAGKTYSEIYQSAIVDNALRNIQVITDAWAEYKVNRNVLVLVTRIAHGELLERAFNDMNIPATFISGKSKMKDRKRVIQMMRDGNKQIFIASTIADVGLDVPRLDSIIEAGAGKSSVTALQRLGRVMRPFPGKVVCHFITYRDTAPYLRDQIDRKIEIWRTEPKFVIKEEE